MTLQDNIDPCRDELFGKNGYFGGADIADGERRTLRFTDANSHHIWTTGWEVIGSSCDGDFEPASDRYASLVEVVGVGVLN